QISALAAALATGAAEHAAGPVALAPAGFRAVGPGHPHRRYRHGDDELEVHYVRDRPGARPVGELAEVVTVSDTTPDRVALEVRGVVRGFDVARYAVPGHDTVVEVDSPLGPVSLLEPPRYADPSAEVAAGSLLAPMPGSVIRVAVEVGDTVTAGSPLLWMEAMKMEHTISAMADGVVAELPVAVGDQVASCAVLAAVTEPDASDTAPATDPDSEECSRDHDRDRRRPPSGGDRRAEGPAGGRALARLPLRLRVRPREVRGRRDHQRAVGRGREAGPAGRQHPRG